MFKFENTIYFYGLVLVPLFVVLALAYFSSLRKKRKALGEEKLVRQLLPFSSPSRRIWKLTLSLLGITSLILALCNLQTGSKLTEVKREGADLIVCLDVSNSMMAQDWSPNRLTRAKLALEKMIDMLEGDRLGIIIFAGEAYVQLPITSDYQSAKMFLSSINTDMVPIQGTNIADAINKGIESFGSDQGKNRSIILISDGEDHEPSAIEAAEDAQQKGIVINSIGIGSEAGVPIPLVENGIIKGYRKDKDGETVVTKLNPELLKTVAEKTNGVYVKASQADLGLGAILDRISELDKQQIESKMYTDYEDQFQWFLVLALFFYGIEFFISERASEWFRSLNLFKHNAKV